MSVGDAHAIREACIAWAAKASPSERALYIRTGSRGPGMPVDLTPPAERLRIVRAAFKIRL